MEIVAWHPRRELTPGKVTRVSSVLERRDSTTPRNQSTKSRLLLIGGVSFAVVLAGWLAYAFTHAAPNTVDPADLQVYNNGGLIIRHVRPPYDARYLYPLYDWPKSKAALKFTYTPFAAVFFAAISYIPWSVLPRLSQLANLLLLVAAAWLTAGVLGNHPGTPPRTPRGESPVAHQARRRAAWQRRRAAHRAGVPHHVPRAGQPAADGAGHRRRGASPTAVGVKGVGVGIAAGIKLIPLVFIPYLLLTRRFRAAALAAGTFAATVVLGFACRAGRLNRLVAAWPVFQWQQDRLRRLGRQPVAARHPHQARGSIHGATAAWMAAALLVAVIGLASAVLLDRAGHTMLGHPDDRTRRPARLADQLGPPLGVGSARHDGRRPLRVARLAGRPAARRALGARRWPERCC